MKIQVAQYDLDNNLIKIFNCVNDAFRKLNKTYGETIGKCCN